MAEQANINVGVNIGEGAKSLRTLKQEFKDIQKDLDNVAVGTDAYKKKLQQLANVKDEIDDLNDAIKSSTGAGKFESFAKVGSAIAGGFSAAQGAMALFGSESEDVQKTLLKVQGAMAFGQGLAQLEDLGNAFKNLKNVIKSAIGATGIGLLIVALGTVAAYWDDIKEAISGVSEEQKKLNAQAEANLKAEQNKLDTIGGQENILKLQGKSEKDILNLKIKQTDAVIAATENQIEQNDITAKAQIAAAKRNKEILKGILDFLTTPLRSLLQGIDLIGDAFGKNFGLAQGFSNLLDKGASILFDPEAETKKAEETRKASLKAIEKAKNDRAGFQLAIQQIDRDAAKKASDSNKQTQDEKLKAEQELQKKLKDLRAQNIDELEKEEKEKLRIAYEAEQESIKNSKANAELKSQVLKELEIKYKDDLKLITDKFEEERTKKENEKEEKRIKDALLAAENEQAALKNQRDLTLQDQINYENQKYQILVSNKLLTNAELEKLENEHNAVIKGLDEQRLAQKRAIQDAEVNLVKDSLNLASELVSTFAGKDEESQRKAFELNKKIKLSLAIIDTIKGVQSAFTTAAASPLTTVFPAYPFIQAGIAGAFGAASIAKIASTQFQSTGGGGGVSAPSGGGGGGAVPAINQVGNTSTNIANLQNQNNQKQEPIKAVVVQTEMASVNQQVNRIEERSKIN